MSETQEEEEETGTSLATIEIPTATHDGWVYRIEPPLRACIVVSEGPLYTLEHLDDRQLRGFSTLDEPVTLSGVLEAVGRDCDFLWRAYAHPHDPDRLAPDALQLGEELRARLTRTRA